MTDAPAPSWEDRLPEWQRRLNTFCENWIFACVVAMGIRHFALEPFRIPSASMEPALYGDPGITGGDFVVVDKLSQRWRLPQRFDMTVFQFPPPEVAVGGNAETAIGTDGKRRDHWLANPPMYRSFVKRAVVLPGERFYLANGDLFVAAKGSETFTVARRPPDLQAAAWACIYRHGAQREPEWYLPWKAEAGSTVTNRQDQGLELTLVAAAPIVFTQPLRNLYLKDGPAYVENRRGVGKAQIVQVALERPLFRIDGLTGNIWDLNDWWVQRLTSADLDHPSHGTLLNQTMREFIGDVRCTFTVSALTGEVACRLREGDVQAVELILSPAGWRLEGQVGHEAPLVLAHADGAVVGQQFALANLDDEVVLTVDGQEAHRSAVLPADPQVNRCEWSWRGVGSMTVSTIDLARDVHYCANGFTIPEVQTIAVRGGTTELGSRAAWANATTEVSSIGANDAKRRTARKDLFHQEDVRAQMLGRKISGAECWARIGYSRETAIQAPDNAYLLLGDNSPQSWDSRNWGWVPAANLRGRVVLRIRAKRFGSLSLPFVEWSIAR